MKAVPGAASSCLGIDLMTLWCWGIILGILYGVATAKNVLRPWEDLILIVKESLHFPEGQQEIIPAQKYFVRLQFTFIFCERILAISPQNWRSQECDNPVSRRCVCSAKKKKGDKKLRRWTRFRSGAYVSFGKLDGKSEQPDYKSTVNEVIHKLAASHMPINLKAGP